MRNFLLSVTLVLLYWAGLSIGWATISDNGYDNLVVAISPDVTIQSHHSDKVPRQNHFSRYQRTLRLLRI